MPLQLCQMLEPSPALLIPPFHSSLCISHCLWASHLGFAGALSLWAGLEQQVLVPGSGSAVKFCVLVLGAVGWGLTEIPEPMEVLLPDPDLVLRHLHLSRNPLFSLH